jgi:VanZ family protein
MSSSERGLKFWISAWLPVLIGIGVICVESTTYFGSDHTSGPLRRVWEFFFGHLSDERWELIHHLIRKTGHFVGYGLLGLAWLRAWWMTPPRAAFLHKALLGLVGTALVAGGDEFHQSFLPNRTSSIYDVLLDCAGAVAAISIAWLIRRICTPKRLARAA